MTYEVKRKAARSRAVSSAFRCGIDPVINQRLFDSFVDERMRRWEERNPRPEVEK